jgi:hypothetical protein
LTSAAPGARRGGDGEQGDDRWRIDGATGEGREERLHLLIGEDHHFLGFDLRCALRGRSVLRDEVVLERLAEGLFRIRWACPIVRALTPPLPSLRPPDFNVVCQASRSLGLSFWSSFAPRYRPWTG